MITTQFRPFKSIIEFQKHFDTDKKCRDYLELYRWNNIPTCPHCKAQNACRFPNGKVFKCRDCRKKFTVTIGTVMECSKVPLTKWFLAMYVATNHSKGISSLQLAKYINCCQKTTWFLLHRIRAVTERKGSMKLSGIIQADESFFGGKNKNRHKDKKVENSQGRSYKDKTPVVGMVEDGDDGFLITRVVKDTKASTLKPIIKEYVKENAKLYTDEWGGYTGLSKNYDHEIVKHMEGEYVRGKVTTNRVEGVWSILKRCIYGIYHSVSPKHLQRYCDEITFRYNFRKQTQDVMFCMAICNVNGRLSWKSLVSPNGLSPEIR